MGFLELIPLEMFLIPELDFEAGMMAQRRHRGRVMI